MITLVSKPVRQKLGIDIHNFTAWTFSQGMLEGEIIHDNTSQLYSVFVSPNYQAMRDIAQPRHDLPLKWEFDDARTHSIGIGQTLNVGYAKLEILKLEEAYRKVLSVYGAKKRVLIGDNGSGKLTLALNDSAKDTRYGDAIVQAIISKTFDSFDSDEPIGYRKIIGRIVPAYLNALGFKEYLLNHDLTKTGFDMVRFTLDGHYAFEFYAPYKAGDEPYVERYRFHKGSYVLSSSTELTTQSLKKEVLEYLIGLAQDLGHFEEQDADMAAKEAAMNKGGTAPILLSNNTTTPKILGLTAPIPVGENVVQLRWH